MRITVGSDIDSIVFGNGPKGDRADWWVVSGGLTGLYGTVKPRESASVNPLSDGDMAPARLTQSGRTISIQGSTAAASSLENGAKLQRLNDLACRWLTITFEDETGRYRLRGWLADDVEPSVWFDRRRLFFTLTIYCPDPHKYGDPVSYTQSGSWLTVSNSGRLPVYPRLSVAGPVSSWRLTGDAGSVSWSGDSVDSVDVDLRDMIPSSGVMGVSPPLMIPPGASRLQCSGTAGMVMTLTLEPAWR